MQDFKVNSMRYGHCERAVTGAVHSVDASATVDVDRTAGRVRVGSTTEPGRIVQAIIAKGYAAELVAA